jgi:hypothetical protein
MIQTHQQLKMISEEYNSLFAKNEFYPLQKAYTTPHFLVLLLRFPGKTIALYIGRGNQYQGVYLSDKAPPTYLRLQDRLLDYFRKFLVGTRFGKLEVDPKAMVWQFSFKTEHSDNVFVLGLKDRQLFFAKKSKEEIYLSWKGEFVTNSSISSLIESLGPDRPIIAQTDFVCSIENYLKDEEKKTSGMPIQKKKEKFLKRKIDNITKDLIEVKNWTRIQDDLNEDLIDLSFDEVIVHGQRLKFYGVESSWQKRDLIFKKIKKLKKAEEILTKRLEESKTEMENVKKGNFEFELTKEKIIQPLWATQSKVSKNQNLEFNIKQFKLKNLNGVLGLDGASNDFIRTQSSKEYYWFHIENFTGSHCIVKTDNFSSLTLGDLSALASMLRDYSKLAVLEIPIVYSQLKNIKGSKGSKGKVIINKPKYLSCVYVNWKEIITIL